MPISAFWQDPAVAKGQDKQKKLAKKPAQKTLKEKRAARHAAEADQKRSGLST